jgi:hypothetical protein
MTTDDFEQRLNHSRQLVARYARERDAHQTPESREAERKAADILAALDHDDYHIAYTRDLTDLPSNEALELRSRINAAVNGVDTFNTCPHLDDKPNQAWTTVLTGGIEICDACFTMDNPPVEPALFEHDRCDWCQSTRPDRARIALRYRNHIVIGQACSDCLTTLTAE